jgi:hypothetical protein
MRQEALVWAAAAVASGIAVATCAAGCGGGVDQLAAPGDERPDAGQQDKATPAEEASAPAEEASTTSVPDGGVPEANDAQEAATAPESSVPPAPEAAPPGPAFRQAVEPTLAGCSTSTCHSTATTAVGYPGGQQPDFSGGPPALRAVLLGKSLEDPSMPLVAPGDPGGSFLWLKVTGRQASADCSRGDLGWCGDPMGAPFVPAGHDAETYYGQALDPEEISAISGWITAGAQP